MREYSRSQIIINVKRMIGNYNNIKNLFFIWESNVPTFELMNINTLDIISLSKFIQT